MTGQFVSLQEVTNKYQLRKVAIENKASNDESKKGMGSARDVFFPSDIRVTEG